MSILLFTGILSVLYTISKGISPEGTPDRATECYGNSLKGSCPGGEVIAVQHVSFGTKLSSTCGLSSTSAGCCNYDSGDCFLPDYTDTAQQAACSGKELCNDLSVSQAVTTSCGGTYPPLSHYFTMEFYCINGTRIASMCSSSTKASTGSMLYLWNQDYPNKIRSTDTSCSCSVEVTSCSSQINVYFIQLSLADGGGSCTQQIQIDDNGRVQTWACSNNTDYEITLAFTSSSNYITVKMENPDGLNDGYVWIGLEGTSDTIPLNVNCPAVQRMMCSDCPTLNAPAHGSLSTTDVTTGTIVTVACDQGYTLDGDVSLLCQTNGSWDKSVGTCKRPDCPTLTTPPHGSLSTNSVTSGTSVNVACDTGYTLDGDLTLLCQTDGSWDKSVGICRPDCPALSNPTNGQISPTTAVSTGLTASYTCDIGYNMIGVNTRTCQSDGTWSDTEPTCSTCSTLSDPPNGVVTAVTNTATYSCADGYILAGDTIRTCQPDNTWSGNEPECIAREIGDTCTVTSDCSAVIDQSKCDNEECVCVDGHTEQNHRCIAVPTEKPGIDGLPTGAIVGIVIAVLVVIAAILLLIFCKKDDRYKKFLKRLKEKSEKVESAGIKKTVYEVEACKIAENSSSSIVNVDLENEENQQAEKKLVEPDTEVKETIQHEAVEPKVTNALEEANVDTDTTMQEPTEQNMEENQTTNLQECSNQDHESEKIDATLETTSLETTEQLPEENQAKDLQDGQRNDHLYNAKQMEMDSEFMNPHMLNFDCHNIPRLEQSTPSQIYPELSCGSFDEITPVVCH